MAYIEFVSDDLTKLGFGIKSWVLVMVGRRKPLGFLICDLRFLSKEQNKVL
jgi:hypothetical protein